MYFPSVVHVVRLLRRQRLEPGGSKAKRRRWSCARSRCRWKKLQRILPAARCCKTIARRKEKRSATIEAKADRKGRCSFGTTRISPASGTLAKRRGGTQVWSVARGILRVVAPSSATARMGVRSRQGSGCLDGTALEKAGRSACCQIFWPPSYPARSLRLSRSSARPSSPRASRP